MHEVNVLGIAYLTVPRTIAYEQQQTPALVHSGSACRIHLWF